MGHISFSSLYSVSGQCRPFIGDVLSVMNEPVCSVSVIKIYFPLCFSTSLYSSLYSLMLFI